MANGMGSLYIGSSGLRTSQNALNTTANNLANVDTTGYVRQQSQLDLTVVRIHQYLSRRRDEHFPYLRAKLPAHWYVLQVRFGR